MELLEYLLIIRRRSWIIIALFLAAVISAAVASMMMTPVYQASTSIMIKSQSSNVSLPFDVVTGQLGQNDKQNYVEILKSRTTLEQVASLLKLDVKDISGNISIQPVQGTDAIRINVQSTNKKTAQLVANTLVDVFMLWSQKDNQKEYRAAREFIEVQKNEQAARLAEAEERLQKYKETQKVVAPEEQVNAQFQNVLELEMESSKIDIELKAAYNKQRELQAQLPAEKKMVISSKTYTNDPLYQKNIEQLDKLEEELAQLLEKFTDKHPDVISKRAEIEIVKKKVNQSVKESVSAQTETLNPIYQSIAQKLADNESEIVAYQARKQALDQAITKSEGKLVALPAKELYFARLTRDKAVAEEIYLMLLKKYEEVRISEAQKTSQVDLIDSAILPVAPIKPNKKLNVAIAGFLGLFIGCGLAFLMDYLDTSIKSEDDIQKYLGIPIMGAIPIIKDEDIAAQPKKRRHHSRDNSSDAGKGGMTLG